MINLKTQYFTKELKEVTESEVFALLSVAPIYEYVKGEKTDTEIGTRYTVADPENFFTFDVKILNQVPVVTQEEIESAKERYWISFTGAMIRPFRIEYGLVKCTITANGAKLETGN